MSVLLCASGNAGGESERVGCHIIQFRRLVDTCLDGMAQSPLHLQVYLNLYKVPLRIFFHPQSLLEEVDSNHIPESAKDAVVNCVLERTDKWMSRFYTLLQEDSGPSIPPHPKFPSR